MSVAVSAWVVVDKQLSSLLDANNQSEALGLTGDTFKYFYTRPWTRAPAFLIGMGLGFALLSYERRLATNAGAARSDYVAPSGEAEDNVPVLSRAAKLILPSVPAGPVATSADSNAASTHARRVDWVSTVALAVALALLGLMWYLPAHNYAGAQGSTPPGGWTKWGIELYTATSRPIWAAALAVVLYLCATGRGGGLRPVLAHPMWAPYVKLSYCAYLLHPLILFGLNDSATTGTRFSAYNVATAYCANLVIVCAAAFLMHLVVEAPFAAAERSLFDAMAAIGRGRKRRGA